MAHEAGIVVRGLDAHVIRCTCAANLTAAAPAMPHVQAIISRRSSVHAPHVTVMSRAPAGRPSYSISDVMRHDHRGSARGVDIAFSRREVSELEITAAARIVTNMIVVLIECVPWTLVQQRLIGRACVLDIYRGSCLVHDVPWHSSFEWPCSLWSSQHLDLPSRPPRTSVHVLANSANYSIASSDLRSSTCFVAVAAAAAAQGGGLPDCSARTLRSLTYL